MLREKRDFDYSYLIEATKQVAKAKRELDETVSTPIIKPLAIISTVLPGTCDRYIKPVLGQITTLALVYNPSFIAMGDTMRDFLNPEFVLLGSDDDQACSEVQDFYRSILPESQHQVMSIPSAEMTKVGYNTAISQKIALANTLMEICHKIPGADVDQVTSALQCAYRRITGPSYMRGGMGDGGGCHPRDNIALGWLAEELELSYDPFTASMRGREEQAKWLARLLSENVKRLRIPSLIAGFAYKPGTNLTTGSPALLVSHFVATESASLCIFVDPHVHSGTNWDCRKFGPVACLIGCEHGDVHDKLKLAEGSVLIDPFRKAKQENFPGVELLLVGIGSRNPRNIEVHHSDGLAMADR